jgi:hypothetical protein
MGATGRVQQNHVQAAPRGISGKIVSLAGIKEGMYKPVHANMRQAREETEMALFSCIEHVLADTGITTQQVSHSHREGGGPHDRADQSIHLEILDKD